MPPPSWTSGALHAWSCFSICHSVLLFLILPPQPPFSSQQHLLNSYFVKSFLIIIKSKLLPESYQRTYIISPILLPSTLPLFTGLFPWLPSHPFRSKLKSASSETISTPFSCSVALFYLLHSTCHLLKCLRLGGSLYQHISSLRLGTVFSCLLLYLLAYNLVFSKRLLIRLPTSFFEPHSPYNYFS